MSPSVAHLLMHGAMPAAQIAAATGQHLEHVYADLVPAESAGLVRVVTDKNHRCVWEPMSIARTHVFTENAT